MMAQVILMQYGISECQTNAHQDIYSSMIRILIYKPHTIWKVIASALTSDQNHLIMSIVNCINKTEPHSSQNIQVCQRHRTLLI